MLFEQRRGNSWVSQLGSLGLLFYVLGVLLGGAYGTRLHAQQYLGGPYQPDSATVVLMHFDGNLTNDHADRYQMAPPEAYGITSFTQFPGAVELGQQLQFDNSKPSYKSHLEIPDTAALDLTGSWTLQMWVRIDSFGTTMDDWRRSPRLLTKPGDENYYQTNYTVYGDGQSNELQSVYYSGSNETFVGIQSSKGVFKKDRWYHVTFIRDSSRKAILQLIHQNATDPGQLPSSGDSLALISYEVTSYADAAAVPVPATSDQPLFIGTSPQNDTSFANLDGAIDELRISNTVRRYPLPPVISGVTDTSWIDAGKPFTIGATIKTYGETPLSRATLHYRINERQWQAKPMTETAGDRYEATLNAKGDLPFGATVDYWISAETNSGRRSRTPTAGVDGDSYYTMGFAADSTQVLDLPFNGLADGTPPVDSSLYRLEVAHHGNTGPRYVQGTDGQALQFEAADSTRLTINSPFLELTSFAVEMDFMLSDSVPRNSKSYLFAKHSGPILDNNYKVYIEDQSLHPETPIMDNVGVGECETRLGDPLHLENVDLEAGRWYTFQFVLSPAEDTVYAKLKDPSADTLLAARGTCVSAPPEIGEAPLYVGAKNKNSYFFNGRIDDIRIWNYEPSYMCICPPTSNATEDNSLPQQVQLHQNYPNPFNPTTKIRFGLPQATHVKITVYDMLGRRVATLVNGKKQAGTHSVTFDGRNLSSGVYIYRLKTEEFSKTRKMLLVK